MRFFVVHLLGILTACVAATGCGAPSFLVTPVANSNEIKEQEVRTGRGLGGSKVAIIEVEGMLSNARIGGLFQAAENPVSLFAQQMNQAASDSSVKAVVLRVNSPGGTVTASDTMYSILVDFRKKTHKPVVAATQEVAASGAYYIMCGTDRIVAHPTSIVGSIGVIFNSFDFEGTMGKLGVVNNAVKSGSLKDMGSPYKSLADHERAVMQEMVDEYFTRFQKLVRDSRPIKEEPLSDLKEYRDLKYAGVFSGRVFSGEEAVKKGLADETGHLEDAIAVAEKLAGVKGSKVVMYKRPYGYGGSIYASGEAPTPRADVMRLELPGARELLPTGFYYLWEPGT